MLRNTAILVFSRTAREEGAGGRYGTGQRRGSRIARHFIRHTEAAAARTGLPVVRIYSSAQRGYSFGERFANAVDDVFSQGYRNVIALGTDTPGITAARIRAIEESLQRGGLVTGPSPDGGVYAIGIPRACWNRELFLDIAWQTNAVQRDLVAYAGSLGAACCTTASLADIDNDAALAKWLRSTGGHPLARIIAAIISTSRAGSCVLRLRQQPHHAQSLLRGPPVLA